MNRSNYWSKERTAAEIKRLNTILDDPGEIGTLTVHRLKAEAEYIKSRAAEVVRSFWRGWSGPTAPAN